MQDVEKMAVLGEPVDFPCSGTLAVLLVLIFVLALLGVFVLLGRELDKRGDDDSK